MCIRDRVFDNATANDNTINDSACMLLVRAARQLPDVGAYIGAHLVRSLLAVHDLTLPLDAWGPFTMSDDSVGQMRELLGDAVCSTPMQLRVALAQELGSLEVDAGDLALILCETHSCWALACRHAQHHAPQRVQRQELPAHVHHHPAVREARGVLHVAALIGGNCRWARSSRSKKTARASFQTVFRKKYSSRYSSRNETRKCRRPKVVAPSSTQARPRRAERAASTPAWPPHAAALAEPRPRVCHGCHASVRAVTRRAAARRGQPLEAGPRDGREDAARVG